MPSGLKKEKLMQIDDSVRMISKGQIAGSVKMEVQEILFQKEDAILARLVARHRNGELTNDQMRGSIGEISGLRSVLEELEGSIRRGITEMEKTVNG